MAQAKQFANLSKIKSGVTAGSDLKMSDIFAVQHIDALSGANTLNQVSVAQSMCQPVAISSNTPNDGAYTADCVNFPDFSLTYRDAYGNDHYYFGLKIRVIFENGITYGSVEDGTYPTLNINGSGAVPLLAQGQTMANGAAVAGQTLEFTLIPYGQNSIAWDADSNVRQNTSLATIYSDGNKRLPCVYCESATTTVTGVPLYSGCTVKVMFTAAITGSNTSTAMVINYNGTNITVKVPVNGSLVDYCAKSVSSSYIYCQAYTTLELLYNGTNFIIMGNPVIYSDADSTIYTDGKIAVTTVNTVAANNMHSVTSNAVASAMSNQFVDVASENVSLTLSANEGTSGNFTFTVPSGYKVVGFNGYITSGPGGAINLYSIGFNNLFGKTGTFTSRIFFRNYTSAQQTASIQVYLLCARV